MYKYTVYTVHPQGRLFKIKLCIWGWVGCGGGGGRWQVVLLKTKFIEERYEVKIGISRGFREYTN